MERIALIPSYEPDNRLIKLVEELKESNFIIVVVNDGSMKKYDKIFKKIKKISTVLSYSTNRGKGYALKTGFKYIQEHYQDCIVVTMDSDGQHTVLDAKKLCDEAEKNKNTLILGKRIRSSNIPLRSNLGNSITRFVYRICTGLDIYDTQTGLRAFNSKLIPVFLSIDGDRFEYEINVLLYCSRNNIKLKEIEISTLYFNNNKGSHFKTIRDSYLIYKEIIKFSCSSIISFILDFLLYSLFLICFNYVLLANILARIISATFNYNINRKLVFHSKKNISQSALEYFTLAIFILIGNTIFLEVSTIIIGINPFLAKIATEIIFFIISWYIQNRFVFKDGGKS